MKLYIAESDMQKQGREVLQVTLNSHHGQTEQFEVHSLEEHDREVAREILSEIRYMKDGQFGEIYERNLQDIAEKYGIKRKA